MQQATEALREGAVQSMRCGDRFVIFVDKLTPNFKIDYNFPAPQWPTYEIFDFQKWRDDDNYMQIVKEYEDYDTDNKQGRYYMHDNFLLIFLATF